jgi:Fe-S-cluster containining protein
MRNGGKLTGRKDPPARRAEIVRRVSDIYKWLDGELTVRSVAAGVCSVCGKCCDFEAFGHRLFVTTPEMIYLIEKLGRENFKQVAAGRCGWQLDGKCTIHSFRFAACRIFCCKGDVTFQSELSEAAVKKFKFLCEEFNITYRYEDLPTALKELNYRQNARE